MPADRDSFGVQAAKFSLYAPVVSFVLGLFLISQPTDSTAAAKSMAAVRVGVAVVQVVLIVSGLGLGVAALATIGKYGRTGILGRAIVGVTINGLLLAVSGLVLLPALMGGGPRTKVVGHWRGAVGAPPQVADLAVSADGRWTYDIAADPAHGVVALAGPWAVVKDGVINLTIDRADPEHAAAVGHRLGFVQPSSIGANDLILSTHDGDVSCHRQ